VQLQAQLLELEEKAAVAGASQLTAEQELTKVCVSHCELLSLLWLTESKALPTCRFKTSKSTQ